MSRSPIQFFRQPYPFGGLLSKKLRENAWIGAFVAFFLVAFQPFGTTEWESPYKYPFLVGYGLVSFVASMLVHGTVIAVLGEAKLEQGWTTGKEVLLNVTILVAIALGNMLYSNWMGITHISLFSLSVWMLIVVLVGIFPLSAGILLRTKKYTVRNQLEAAQIEDSVQQFQTEVAAHPSPTNTQLAFWADNEKEVLLLYPSELLYIESADNYANFVYLQQGAVQKRLLRGALKRFEDQIGEHPHIVRCHRSFIVNLSQVAHVFGNAQGYRLTLSNSAQEVPVARNYGPSVLERLQSLSH